MNFERIEYYCPECHDKGVIEEVFINPTVMLIKGLCSRCQIESAVRAIDLLQLADRIDQPGSYTPEPKTWARIRYNCAIQHEPSRKG